MAGHTQHSMHDQMASRGAQIVEIKPQPSVNQDRFKIQVSQDTYVTTDKGAYRGSVSCLEASLAMLKTHS